MPIELRVDGLDRTRARLKRVLGNKRVVNDLIVKVMRRWGQVTATKIGRDIQTGRAGLKSRTGTLAKSIASEAGLIHRGQPAVKVGIFAGPALAYARLQELGGVITPKKGRALAIPVEGGPALTASGVPRYETPRDFPGGLYVRRFNSGDNAQAGLFSIADGTLAYLLMRRVKIKPKHYLRDGFTRELPALAMELRRAFAEVLRASRGGGGGTA